MVTKYVFGDKTRKLEKTKIIKNARKEVTDKKNEWEERTVEEIISTYSEKKNIAKQKIQNNQKKNKIEIKMKEKREDKRNNGIEMLTRGKKLLLNKGDNISMECTFKANFNGFNLFDYPVNWKKTQLSEQVQVKKNFFKFLQKSSFSLFNFSKIIFFYFKTVVFFQINMMGNFLEPFKIEKFNVSYYKSEDSTHYLILKIYSKIQLY